MSLEDNSMNFDSDREDGSNGVDSNSSSDEVLEYDVKVQDSYSEPGPKPDLLVNYYVTYSTECQPMIRLIENQRRTDSLEELSRYLKPILASDFERGAQLITQEVTRRLSVFQYASVYKFSEGLRDPGTQVCKMDLFRDDILLGDLDGERTLPSYFKPFFVLSCTELLRFSDFMESVDFSHVPMTAYVIKDMKIHFKHFHTLSAIKNFRCDEFQKCLDELDSLIVRFKKCKEELYKDYQFFYQARDALRSIVIQISNAPDTPISFGATPKLFRLRDFCSYYLVIYANTVIEAMELMKVYSNTKTKLCSFQIL